MIEFTSLYIQNFLSFFGETKLPLGARGMLRVKGRNNDDQQADANDVGKSNLLSAITWCLYERLAKTENKVLGDSVVNSEAGCNTIVQLSWKEGKKTYAVTRYRKHSVNGDSCQMTWTDGNSKGSRKVVNQDIVKTLGMSYEMFLKTVFWPQGMVKRLTQFKDSDFKRLFDELVGTEYYEQKRDKISALRTKLLAKQEDVNRKVAIKEALLDSKKQDAKELFERLKLSAAYQSAEKTIKDLDTLVSSWTDSVRITNESSQKWRSAESVCVALQKEAFRLKKSLSSRLCDWCGQELKAESKLRRHYASEKLKLKRAKEAEEYCEKEYTKLKAATDAFAKAMERLRKKLPDEYRQNVEALRNLLRDRKVYKSRLVTVHEDMSQLRQSLVTLHEKQEKLDRIETKLQLLQEAYGPAGLRTLRLLEITPRLNELTKSVSQRLVDGCLTVRFSTTSKLKGGDVRERYSMKVWRDKKIDFVLSGGGMQRRADLIGSFALDKLRRELTGKEVNLRVYDEVTDGVDTAGESAVVDLLRDECRGTTVFISHRTAIDDTAFDGVLTVVRDAGRSSIEGS